MTPSLATGTSVLSSTAPEPSQLVEVCRSQWIISGIYASAGALRTEPKTRTSRSAPAK